MEDGQTGFASELNEVNDRQTNVNEMYSIRLFVGIRSRDRALVVSENDQ